jgi:hypothetical protein
VKSKPPTHDKVELSFFLSTPTKCPTLQTNTMNHGIDSIPWMILDLHMTLRNVLVELPFKHDIEGGDGMLSLYCWPLCFSKQFIFKWRNNI